VNVNTEQIMHHHGTTDPTDYQVEDVLMCIADGQGLHRGELYITEAVARRRARGRVVTTVTVSANFRVLEVVEAEAFLRRTRVVVEVMAPNGDVTVHSFPDSERLDVWCAFTRTPANRVRNKHYVEAEPTPPGRARRRLRRGVVRLRPLASYGRQGRRRPAVAQPGHLERARSQSRVAGG
jgi:hypothetical protein